MNGKEPHASEEEDPLDAYMATLTLPAISAAPDIEKGPAVEDRHWAETRDKRASSTRIGNSAVVRNRRYVWLQHLLSGAKAKQEAARTGGDVEKEINAEDWYFSDAMMQQRDPALFHLHLGQFLPTDASNGSATTECGQQNPTEPFRLSSFLLNTYTRSEMETRRTAEQEKWGNYTSMSDRAAKKRERELFQEDNDDEEEEESDDDMDEEEAKEEEAYWMTMSLHERRQYLIDLMSQRFLEGKDKDYVNYEEIDTNEALDDIEQMQRDAEDLYFATDD